MLRTSYYKHRPTAWQCANCHSCYSRVTGIYTTILLAESNPTARSMGRNKKAASSKADPHCSQPGMISAA